jgi:hypothetical protein
MSIQEPPTQVQRELSAFAIPGVDDVSDEVSPTWAYLQRRHASRRVVLKGALAAVGALMVESVVGLPFFKERQADAATYTVWNSCTSVGYYNSSTICTPSSWYYGSDNRGYAVSWRPYTYWHREGFVSPTGRTYTHYPTTCNGHNAWIWWKNYRSYYNVMCSDGHVRSYTGWASSSICRSLWT